MIVRFSETNLLVPGLSKGLNPAVAFKFLRDQVHSSNIMSKVAFEPEDGNWDFFANDFGTQIAAHKTDCSPKSYARLNARYSTEYLGVTGSVDTGRWDQDGTEIEVKDVDFPFYLRFVPNRDVLPTTNDGSAWFDQLKGPDAIPIDTKLFDVYAMWGSPCDGKGCKHDKIPSGRDLSEMEMIGEIISTSNDGFTTSLWGDERLFFQH